MVIRVEIITAAIESDNPLSVPLLFLIRMIDIIPEAIPPTRDKDSVYMNITLAISGSASIIEKRNGYKNKAIAKTGKQMAKTANFETDGFLFSGLLIIFSLRSLRWMVSS